MLNQLSMLAQQGQLRPIDYQFARFINSLHDDPVLTLCSALVSYELGKGNVCLPLDSTNLKNLFDLPAVQSDALFNETGTRDWQGHLQKLPPVGSGKNAGTPLILDHDNLYLSRYWHYEQRVTEVINKPSGLTVDVNQTRKILDQLFVESDSYEDVNWQKVAAAVASSQPFTVISGGPGTGKTTTVTRLLALLIELGMLNNQCPDIFLVAPTGKAAARLTESIGNARDELTCSNEVKQAIPSHASTIHRLLGVIPGKPGFRHNRGNQLHLDVLVVDEASMVDLPLMFHLLDALPDNARLVLLGDRDQLASVEAGSVLGDICGFAEQGYSPEQAKMLQQLTGYDLSAYASSEGALLRNSLCLLRKSYRFDANSGIGHLARAVNEGRSKDCTQQAIEEYADVNLHNLDAASYQQMLKLAVSGYREYLEAIRNNASEKNILTAFNNFRLLCALREGSFGVQGLNEAICKALLRAGLLSSDSNTNWYTGRPVMITRNDHGLSLYNGDIGIVLPDDNGRLRVVFEMPDGEIRSLLPSRLPEHDTVFAMTVHKSQGSEFRHTAMILPDKMNLVLTRELIYTGITRAKQQLDIFAREDILGKAIAQKTVRASGLPLKIMQQPC